MTATAAEALELALWLHRAPARRAALAGRPLPDGIGQLLRVAGGAEDQVAAAARITGADEATILEAVRFYLQQMLFQDEADAYRVLGLSPDASPAQAREHHRLLQHWLHPDRRGPDQWETIYATRVNRAWSRLRTPQARAAYDATLATRSAAHRGSRHGGESTAPATPVALRPQRPSPRNHSRNLTLVVLLGCAGLLALIALRNEQPPEWMDERAAAPHPPAAPAPAVPDGSALAASLEALAAGTVAQVETAAAAIVPAQTAPPPSPRRPEPLPVTLPAAGAAMAANAPRQPPTTPRLPAAEPRPAPLGAASTPVGAATAANIPAPALPPPPAIVLAAATPTPVLPVPAPPVVAQPIPDPLDRMRQARTRARQVLAYLGDPTALQPPVWNDLATAQSATALRAALLDRLPTGARLDLREPQWRLSPDGARLESAYVADAHGGGGESGRIALDFVWREDRLLVRGLSLVAQ